MYRIVSFYVFTKQSDAEVRERADFLRTRGQGLGLRGLVLVSREGFNQTVTGSDSSVDEYLRIFTEQWGMKGVEVKYSESDRWVFPRFKVKIKAEIVSLRRPDLAPERKTDRHLSPQAFREAMNEPGAVLIDTRNSYETALGTFEGAVDPGIEHFSEFPAFVDQSDLKKDAKILMYCTGGIRCEKAILSMQEKGFTEVFQLDGGILNYFEQVGGDRWNGECFLFDHRVAVTPDLKPSKRFGLCPHCGDPGDQEVTCLRCQTSRRLCERCAPKNTCSKNCTAILENQSARHKHRIKIRSRKSASDGSRHEPPRSREANS